MEKISKELPTMQCSNVQLSSYGVDFALPGTMTIHGGGAVGPGRRDTPEFIGNAYQRHQNDMSILNSYSERIKKAQEKDMADQAPKRRIVQVFIVDPEESVPLEKCVIYRGNQEITDSTDQELFFELDLLKVLLEKYNEERVTFPDKKAASTEKVFLPKARVRDLKMIVVNVATF